MKIKISSYLQRGSYLKKRKKDLNEIGGGISSSCVNITEECTVPLELGRNKKKDDLVSGLKKCNKE
ncbi:20385_t:CDS:2 [Rhizophagus irregularis]|nr:20385_t:CDS:2 [Rhizophagus irregularis]